MLIRMRTTPVELVLANLGEGISRFELLQAYPSLSDKDIDAALAFAAELSRMTHESLPFEEPVRRCG